MHLPSSAVVVFGGETPLPNAYQYNLHIIRDQNALTFALLAALTHSPTRRRRRRRRLWRLRLFRRYLALLAKQTPIESCFIKALPDHLNAEVSSGTVTTVEEGVTWLSYTYLHVRMRRNPMAYGVPLSDRESDPMLLERRRQLITQAAETLDDHKVLLLLFFFFLFFQDVSGIYVGIHPPRL